MTSVSKIFTPLMKNLSDREREVLTARFGLDGGATLTLAALGKRYEVTRERIRQIEASALGAVGRNITDDPAAAEIVSKNKKFLANQGGVAQKQAVFEFNRNLLEGLTEPHLALFLDASGPFYSHPEDKHFWPFYHLNSDVLKNVTAFVHQWSSLLKSKRKAVLAGAYEEELRTFVKKAGVPYEHAANFLGISKKIGKNPFGDSGLAEWPEIHPKTVRDRIYLVMKKKQEPLHFQTIATMINEAGFRGRKASAPTVHNELIKDKRFVLVGRGMYALSEYGYEPGTAREVIHRILRKNGPLKPREIIQAVEKERFFKSNTVLVNLQNKSFFKRLPDGTYKTREA